MATDASALTAATNPAAAHYAFTMRPGEASTYRSLIIRRQKRYVDRTMLIAIPAIGLLCIAGAIKLATDRGLLPAAELRLMVIIAAASFVLGYLLFGLASIVAALRMARATFADTRNAKESFDCTFDETGFVVKRGDTESRVAWSAVVAVQDARSIVVLWYDPSQGFFIPARAFRDNMARVTFAAWASERVRAAMPVRTR
jgi:hypothetical protein